MNDVMTMVLIGAYGNKWADRRVQALNDGMQRFFDGMQPSKYYGKDTHPIHRVRGAYLFGYNLANNHEIHE